MNRILIIILLSIPFFGFGQLYSIPKENNDSCYIDYDVIPNGKMESYYLDKYTYEEFSSEIITYYKSRDKEKNYRPKKISWSKVYDYPYNVNTSVLFHSNGKVKSISIVVAYRRHIEKSDSGFFNLDGSDKIKNQSRFYNAKEKFEILGNYLYNMSKLDSISNIKDQKLVVIYELDRLLNKYYNILKIDMENKQFYIDEWYDSNSFKQLKKSQNKWLKERGDLITMDYKYSNDLIEINKQIKLYQNRIFWLRNQMRLYFHEYHIFPE